MQGEDKNVASYHFRVAVKGHSIFLETSKPQTIKIFQR